MLRHALRYPYLQRAQPCNVLRRLDFNSPHIIGRRLRLPPSRNTEAAVAQAVGGTAVAVAQAVEGQEAEELAVELEAVPVAALAVVRVVVPEAAPVEAPVAEKAGLGAARQEASAHTAIRLTIRRGRLFRNFLRRLRPISR
jgi:hypothetical protein